MFRWPGSDRCDWAQPGLLFSDYRRRYAWTPHGYRSGSDGRVSCAENGDYRHLRAGGWLGGRLGVRSKAFGVHDILEILDQQTGDKVQPANDHAFLVVQAS